MLHKVRPTWTVLEKYHEEVTVLDLLDIGLSKCGDNDDSQINYLTRVIADLIDELKLSTKQVLSITENYQYNPVEENEDDY